MNILKWDKNLKIRLFGEGLFGLLFWMFFPFMAIYFTEELGVVLAGTLLVLSQFLSVIANLLGGYLVDRFGRKVIMVWSSAGQALSFVVFALANSPWHESPMVTFFAFSFLGIMGSLYHPASRAMIADLVPLDEQRAVFSVFYTAANLNVVAGPIIGGFLFFQHRFLLLIACTIVTLMLFFIISIFIRETNPAQLSSSNKVTFQIFIKDQIKNYSIIFKDKVFFMFIIAGVLASQTFMQMDLLIPLQISNLFQPEAVSILGFATIQLTSEKMFSWVVAENGLLVVLLTVFIAKITSSFSEQFLFISSSLLYALSMILFSQSQFLIGFVLSMFVFTMGELMGVGVTESYVAKLAPEDMRGQYYAASSLRFTIGRTIAPLSIPLAGGIGFTQTFIILSFLSIGSAYIYFHMFKTQKLLDQSAVMIAERL